MFFMPNAVDFDADWLVVGLAVLGFVALLKYKLSVIKLVVMFAVIGF